MKDKINVRIEILTKRVEALEPKIKRGGDVGIYRYDFSYAAPINPQVEIDPAPFLWVFP